MPSDMDPPPSMVYPSFLAQASFLKVVKMREMWRGWRENIDSEYIFLISLLSTIVRPKIIWVIYRFILKHIEKVSKSQTFGSPA